MQAEVIPKEVASSAESRGQDRALAGSPAGDGPHQVLTDTLLPPQEPGTVIKEHCTSQPPGNTKGGKAQEEQGLCYFKGFQGAGSLRKGKNEFPVFQAQQRK